MKRKTFTQKQIIKFELMLINNEKSKNTIEKYMRDIQYFNGYSKGQALNKNLIISYKAHLKEKYALTSANSMITALNSFLKFIGRSDLCVKQFKVQQNVYCSKNSELTKKEYFALLSAAERKGKMRLSLLLQTICSTGIRVSELELITVESLIYGEATVSSKNKTRKVFICKELRTKLKKYAKTQKITEGKIFVTKSGKAINRSNIWREMKAICKEAGVIAEKVFPHNLRHLFAKTFYNLEKDISRLADVLGHSSINTTRIYIITSGEEHRRCIENMKLLI